MPKYLLTLRKGTLGLPDNAYLRKYTNFPVYLVEKVSDETLAVLSMQADIEPDSPVYKHQDTVPWGIRRVGALSAQRYFRGMGVKVGIIDTGIDINHVDLKANIYGGYNFVNNSGNFDDDEGHGTHVAGTVAAARNGIGVLGVAPSARLYGLKVLDSQGFGSLSNLLAAIDWAITNKLRIISLSLGSSQHSRSLELACQAAYNAGILIIASSGNDGASGCLSRVNYPAAFSTVIAVGSLNYNMTLSSFSSTGKQVELVAPGRNILSTLPGNSYGYASGTSMATPHVTGIASLIIQARPAWSNRLVRNHLITTAYKGRLTSRSCLYGYGMASAYRAIFFRYLR